MWSKRELLMTWKMSTENNCIKVPMIKKNEKKYLAEDIRKTRVWGTQGVMNTLSHKKGQRPQILFWDVPTGHQEKLLMMSSIALE